MSALDNILTNIYKNIVGFNNITNISSNTILNANATCLTNLNISGNSYLQNSISINSNFNINSNSILNNFTSFCSNLYISNNSIIDNIYIQNNLSTINFTLNNNLNISKNTIINNNCSFLSTMNIYGNLRVDNIIKTSYLGQNNNNITLNGNVINIGTTNSIINIFGQSNYVAVNNLNIDEKLFQLNINGSNLSAFDIGSSSGIEIFSTNNTGFIQTTDDALRYLIKTPINLTSNYILTQDNNYNLNISGSSILQNNVSLVSELYISNNTILNNTNLYNLYIKSNLYTNNLSNNSTLFINNNSLLNGSVTILSNLNINSNIFVNNISINSLLYVSSNSLFNNISLYSSLFVTNNTIINNNCSINNLLYVNNNININDNLSINSKLFISNNTIINKNLTINSNLNITSNVNLIGNVSLNSSLSVCGNTILNGNNTFGSQLANINILGSIICNIPEYLNNIDAKLGGISIGGFYRTGGALKIRLNDSPPVISLLGLTSVSININKSYTDPGITVTDYFGNNLLGYVTSIGTNLTNIISNSILITGTTTLITSTSLFSIGGNYTITYQATDSSGNIGINYRSLYINGSSLLVPFSINNIAYTYQIINSIVISPVITSNPNVFTWTTPYNNNSTSVAGSGIGWALSSSYLQYIKFSSVNSNWCFVFKVILTNASYYFRFNSNVTNWAPLSYSGTTYSWSPSIGGSTYNSPVYVNISNSSNVIKIQIVSLTGTILQTSPGQSLTYTYLSVPFIIHNQNYLATYNTGVYYNNQYVDYSVYNSYFA